MFAHYLNMKRKTILKIPQGKEYLIDAVTEEGVKFFKKGDGLPTGIIDKKYTGVGATTLELNSHRNSILVFPFSALTQEKSNRNDQFHLFVNDERGLESLANYLSNDQFEFKKLCLVADRLVPLFYFLKREGYNLDSFHLLLDEIEVLQLQSTFRDRLPTCYEIAKAFKNVTYLSATPIGYSDPELKGVTRYSIVKNEQKRRLFIHKASHPVGYLAHLLVDLKSEFNGKQVFVALNDLSGIKEVSDVLLNFDIPYNILVANNSEKGFSQVELGELKNCTLPSTINLATSSHFSGVDINGSIATIAVSNDKIEHHSLSYENLIQIFGRSRNIDSSSYHLIIKANFNTKAIERSISEVSQEEIQELAEFCKIVSNLNVSDLTKSSILNKLCEVRNNNLGLLFVKNRTSSISPNRLLLDVQNHRRDKLKDYDSDSRRLLTKLKSRFDIEVSKSNKSLIWDYDNYNIESVLSQLREINLDSLRMHLTKIPNPELKAILLLKVLSLFGNISHKSFVNLFWKLNEFKSFEGKRVSYEFKHLIEALQLMVHMHLNFPIELCAFKEHLNQLASPMRKIQSTKEILVADCFRIFRSYLNSIKWLSSEATNKKVFHSFMEMNFNVIHKKTKVGGVFRYSNLDELGFSKFNSTISESIIKWSKGEVMEDQVKRAALDLFLEKR